jgi:hypothetical protein
MADAGMSPIMKDLNQNALELGLKQSSENFLGSVKRKKMTPISRSYAKVRTALIKKERESQK